MKDPRPQPIHRKDYRPPAYLIDEVELRVCLFEDHARTHATLHVRRNPAVEPTTPPHPLVLQGETLTLEQVTLDGTALTPEHYRVDDQSLTLVDVPERFVLSTVVRTEPQSNTQLEGLYRSGRTFCTQCEAEGFRRITYFLDRPDVMARYTTTIEAERERYPVLLSNGNREGEGELPDGRHFVRWRDPFPKPCYLFALVAADLRCHAGTFTTRSGRTVRTEIWVEPHNVDACEHALRSLHKAMAWDEEVFGLEYDLDVYMVVAVSDFNMAAMENKGLNIFNDKFVLARPRTATDDDFENIEGVIAHEYFHNWTGNRVTCRDWFQLTLKEGLTVFRDEQFSADMGSPAVKRIMDVRTLRTAQFAEDASPTAHPIRPDAYIEMNNFYTVTVYSKGAEVIRMIHTLLGPEGFRKGMDLYFERHDGRAVTCDDFVAAMADGSGVDLRQFARWYDQVGTPVVEAAGVWDEGESRYTLTLRQRPPATAQGAIEPLHIPVRVGLVDPDGRDQVPSRIEPAARLQDGTALLELREPEQTFTFHGIDRRPVPSVLRGFSAPVKLELPRDEQELAFAMGHDPDPFNRWDAAQSYAQRMILGMVADRARGRTMRADAGLVDAWGKILVDPRLDGSLKSLMLTLPDERVLGQAMDEIDVDGIHDARKAVLRALADAHAQALRRTYEDALPGPRGGPYRLDREAIAARRLRASVLWLLGEQSDADGRAQAVAWAQAQLRDADNMTDAEAALMCLVEAGDPARQAALDDFHAQWKDDPLVIDKWFSVQAVSGGHDTLERVIGLTEHPDFTLKNPNRVRSLLGAFSVRNQVHFHAIDGRGYALLADHVLELDRRNPQAAARLLGPLGHWQRYDAGRRERMREQLLRISRRDGLSRDVFELTTKALGS
ncbi:aminopeptidase N [Paraliomyxa miuraensis]|uniref:aminopeptidase N n=1 Tax=Paraliomyxa miuraensis TaxID=376150 RepID=UPI0022565301|nr:aminopeptidase N [Paraliomyxa miuraensis]MCX4245294.1 aminopeptidase N [Paraliomyxa miuraensis]